jgi:hypothetical protein
VIVCPECRHINDEDAVSCARCGRSLEPVATYMLPRRAASQQQTIDVPLGKPPSRWRVWAALGALVLIAGVTGIWFLLRPDPCRGTNFSSKNFGYCLNVPEGWTAEPAQFGSSVQLDQFAPQSQGATVIVEAVDLQAGADLGGFADFVRGKDKQAGLDPGPGTSTTIDGVAAEEWDMTTSSGGGTTFQLREVVMVKGQVGWRITLNDLADSFGKHSGPFRQMLESWRFR